MLHASRFCNAGSGLYYLQSDFPAVIWQRVADAVILHKRGSADDNHRDLLMVNDSNANSRRLCSGDVCQKNRKGFVTAVLVLTLVAGIDEHSRSFAAGPDDSTISASPEDGIQDSSPVAELNNEALAVLGGQSLVVIRSTDRSGQDHGLGAGFVIDESGLIVTARHVIGDGRDFVVELPDKTVVPVMEVYSSSNRLDLAIIRVDAKGLRALAVSPDNDTAQGRDVVAMGHPRGLRYTIAAGIVAGHQEVDGIRMLQLAMAIEPGNSGGPLLDRRGNVVGVVTMKSSLAQNVGFALPARMIRELLDNPNPIPMNRWRTIGTLDNSQWTTVFGATWRQRAGKIIVRDQGTSFGGRTLCLRNAELPGVPVDLQVMVKLNDEAGAAGLVFHADGEDRHYGFYPSGGNLRLTRFDGPDVNSWTILHNAASPAYKPGDWNLLTVRIQDDRFECFVNGQLVVESRDSGLPRGRAGLAAFRGTAAEFRRFDIGDQLLPSSLSPEGREIIASAVGRVRAEVPADADMIAELLPLGESASDILAREAAMMEQRSTRLRQLSRELHDIATRQKLAGVLGIPADPDRTDVVQSDPVGGSDQSREDRDDETQSKADRSSEPDLLRAALLLAHMDNPDVDVDDYVARLDDMANEVWAAIPADTTEPQRLAALDHYLFEQVGLRGSQYEYYVRSNSYLNEVIDDREGLPITLSVLYMEMARRLKINVVGVGLPGHFVVRYEPADSSIESVTIDPFERGRRLSEQDIRAVLSNAGFPNEPRFRESWQPRQIVERMVSNLLRLAESDRNDTEVLRYLETLVMLAPGNVEHRARRLEIRARTGRLEQAIADANWFTRNQVPGVDLERVRAYRLSLEEQLERRNASLRLQSP